MVRNLVTGTSLGTSYFVCVDNLMVTMDVPCFLIGVL
jgi:hypothetical protein